MPEQTQAWSRERPSLEIRFVREDFEGILLAAEIEPDSVTVEEWRKFTDRFLDGTNWGEAADHACDAIIAERSREDV